MPAKADKSISDLIEDYLKGIFGQSAQIEIRRAELADHFDVVPSQINYVIKTRFTPQRGYFVQSKRGGGGYIRIERASRLANVDLVEMLIDAVGDAISEHDAETVICTLVREKLITKGEAALMATMVAKTTLQLSPPQAEQALRARVLRALLNRLCYKN